MKKIVIALVYIFASPVWAGSLFSFDKNQVLVTALQQIKLRHSDLAKLELNPIPINPELDRASNLYAIIHFSYMAKNSVDTLFVCVSLDENGNVITMVRDIESREGIFKTNRIPVNAGCYQNQKP